MTRGRLQEEINAKKAEEQEALKAEVDELVQSALNLWRADPPACVKLFKVLYVASGWGMTPVTRNPQTGEINPTASLYATAKQDVYRAVRKFLPDDLITQLERTD